MLKLIVYSVIVLLVIVMGLIFGFRNETEIAVDFIFAHSPAVSIGFWILLSFLLGSIVGWVIGFPGNLALKLANKNLNRKLKRQENELSRLKGETVKGS